MLQVKEFVESMGLDRKEVIQALREEFPGFDKTLLSKVENPDKYGVRLLNRGEQILEENFSNTALVKLPVIVTLLVSALFQLKLNPSVVRFSSLKLPTFFSTPNTPSFSIILSATSPTFSSWTGDKIVNLSS